MPSLSEFYGITIYMYYREYHLRPHFQAVHAGKQISVAVADMTLLAGEVGRGNFDTTAWKQVQEWGWLHQAELFDRWEARSRGEPLAPIAPLR